jgi:hypothetical protein
MKSLRELEKQLEALEAEATKHALHMTLEDGRNIQINFREPDGILRVFGYAIRNEDHPCKKYIMQAVKGHPDEGQMVLLCKAIWDSHDRLEAEKVAEQVI